MKIAICDDDKQEHVRLDLLLKEYRKDRGVNITYSFFYSGVDLIADMKNNEYDFIVLDIVMPGINGMQTAKEIRLFNRIVQIAFLSSSPEFEMESYSVGAYDYLLKPINSKNLFPLLDKISAEVDRRGNDSLVVKSHSGIVRIPFHNIEHVEVMNKTVFFHMVDGSVRDTSASLLDFETQLLARGDFLKVHRSFLVNMRCVQTLSTKGIVTQTGHAVPVSKMLYPQIKEAYMKYLFTTQPIAAKKQSSAAQKMDDFVFDKKTNAGCRILLVDDEQEQLKYWANVLHTKGCAVDLAQSAEAAVSMAGSEVYDCVILDVMLFGESSFDYCKQLREHTDAPIVFLSSLTDSDSQLKGFLSGGIDYITKDTPSELFWAKIDARIRLAHTGKVQLLFKPLVLDISLRKVFIDEIELVLTPTEFDLLWVLAEHKGRIYTPEELYHAVWGMGEWDGGQSVQVHMSRMRRKLEKACAGYCFIETSWGKGYSFVYSGDGADAQEVTKNEGS